MRGVIVGRTISFAIGIMEYIHTIFSITLEKLFVNWNAVHDVVASTKLYAKMMVQWSDGSIIYAIFAAFTPRITTNKQHRCWPR